MKHFVIFGMRWSLFAALVLGLMLSQSRKGSAQQGGGGPSSGLVPGNTAVPINLAAALELAEASNLDIAQAREAVNQARAALLRAQVQLLPNFNLGSIYTHHEGTAQKTEGNIIFANKDSLFVGGGPSLTFQTTDALFGPEIARQLTAAAQAGAQRVSLETLVALVDGYFTVQLSRRRLARVDATLEALTSEVPADSRAKLKGALPLVRDFVKAEFRGRKLQQPSAQLLLLAAQLGPGLLGPTTVLPQSPTFSTQRASRTCGQKSARVAVR